LTKPQSPTEKTELLLAMPGPLEPRRYTLTDAACRCAGTWFSRSTRTQPLRALPQVPRPSLPPSPLGDPDIRQRTTRDAHHGYRTQQISWFGFRSPTAIDEDTALRLERHTTEQSPTLNTVPRSAKNHCREQDADRRHGRFHNTDRLLGASEVGAEWLNEATIASPTDTPHHFPART